MFKPLLFLATIFAVLFISACSSGGDGNLNCKLPNGNCIKTSEDDCYAADGVIGQCQAQNYNGYCVDRDYRICIPSTEDECSLISMPYNRTCPNGYDSSPEACYFNSYSDYGCQPLSPPYFNAIECRNEGGNPMDLGNCLRTIGMFTQGSCETYNGCFNNVSQYDCTDYGGNFTINGTCSSGGGNNYGSCTLYGQCVPNVSQSTCSSAGGSFVPNGTCSSGGNNYGSCTVSGQCYDDISQSECLSARGSFVPNGTCSSGGNNYGSCTLPGYACIENLSRYECDESRGEVFASNGTCSAASFPYCADPYYGDCDRIGGSYISSKSECFYGDGFLANLKFCQENGFDIEGIDY